MGKDRQWGGDDRGTWRGGELIPTHREDWEVVL